MNELLSFCKKHRPSTAICLIERAADNLINFQAFVRKKLSKFELLKVFKKQRSPAAICLIERPADSLINFQAVVKKLQKAITEKLRKQQRAIQVLQRIFVSVQNGLLYYRALRTLCEKRRVNFSYDTFQTFDTHRVYNQSQPSLREQYLICKLYVRMRSANRIQLRMWYVVYCCDHTTAHGQG